ncbi:F-box/kelch-repeat protein At1g26930-like [Impatiens glandulifera]|uniref:F-box/kelch-repeat protein At1g26930-like n=1 Tax=Impatiens glandulifera TaxID=253017 RepID=UPI001FB14063|nr:F-box/kelch-repeat protein At1g26930-like [Impatiens glandulifera]XP_047323340.1 F-box/kelch-repeat protein At1g26930-like [Impatiens glandulifera]
MLEDRPCQVTRGYLKNCGRKHCWDCLKCQRIKIEELNGKQPLAIDVVEEEHGANNLPLQLEGDLSMPPVHQSDDQQQAVNDPDFDHEEDEDMESDVLSDNQHQTESDLDLDLEEDELNLLHNLMENDLSLAPVIDVEKYDQGGNKMLKLSENDRSMRASDQSDDPNMDALIHGIGRDNSISCLLRSSRSDYGSIAAVSKAFNSLVKNGELYRLRRQIGMVEHWVYICCDLPEWEAFDPNLCRWMHLPPMTAYEYFSYGDKESLAVGSQLLVFGKEYLSNIIHKYSLLTNSWSTGMSMNFPRCLFGSASMGEMAILAGGCDSGGAILNNAEMYNAETGIWKPLPNMNKKRKMCSGVFMDGKFYVIGGIGVTSLIPLSCGEEFDLETETWTEIPDMSPVRISYVPQVSEAPPLVAVVDNELYAADHAAMVVRKYVKNSREWISLGKLPERASSVSGWGLAFRACGNRLICIGGPRSALGGGFVEVNSWKPSEGGPPRWNLLSRKQSPSFVYNCAVMGC